jgi:hypothetical protein
LVVTAGKYIPEKWKMMPENDLSAEKPWDKRSFLAMKAGRGIIRW